MTRLKHQVAHTVLPLTNTNAITVAQLHEWLDRFVSVHGDQGTIWTGDRDGLSNEAIELCRLNKSDVILLNRTKTRRGSMNAKDAKTRLFIRVLKSTVTQLTTAKLALVGMIANYDDYAVEDCLQDAERGLDSVVRSLTLAISRLSNLGY